MLKKLLIAIGSIIAVIAVLIIVAGIIVYSKVNKDFISSKMKLKKLPSLILKHSRKLKTCRESRLRPEMFLPILNL